MRISKKDEVTDILKLISPGTPIREGLDNILKAKTGALLVFSDTKEVLDIVDGGFFIDEEYTSSKFEYNKSPYLTPRQLLNYINRQQGTDYANVETVMLVSAGEQIDMYNPDYDFYYCVDELDALEYYVQFWHNDLTTDYIYVTVDWNENSEDWDVVASQTSTKKIHSDFLMLGMTKYMRADGYLDDSQMDTVCDVNNQILRNLNE